MKIEVDGIQYNVDGGNLLDVLKDLGFDIPYLCYHKAIGSYGSCRLCIVEVEDGGNWKIVTSCSVNVTDGMKVKTNSERVHELRKGVIELLAKYTSSEVVKDLAMQYGLKVVGEKKCVLCGLCVNVCSILESAISFEGRGIERKVNAPFGIPTDVCAGCLACVNVCPTGAMRFENGRLMVGKRVLAEHRILRCEECGKEVITERHKKKLGVEKVLCESCRKRQQAKSYAKSGIWNL